MGWPFNRLQSFSRGTPIQSSVLNGVQDYIANLFSPLLSMTKARFDGVGNQSVSIAALMELVANTDDTKLFTAMENAGRLRWLLDRNGLPGGKVNIFRSSWRAAWLTNGAAGSWPNTTPTYPDGSWKMATKIGAPGTFVQTSGAISGIPYGGCTLNVDYGNANAGDGYSVARTQQDVCVANSAITWKVEFDIGIDAIGANGAEVWFGLASGQDPFSSPADLIWLHKTSAQTNWQFELNKTGFILRTHDIGTPPKVSSAGLQRAKFEIHGAATPVGVSHGGVPVVAVYLDDVLVYTAIDGANNDHIPQAQLYLIVAGKCTTGLGASSGITAGTVNVVSNTMA